MENQTTPIFPERCDICGKNFTGTIHPVYDENYNLQKGLKKCDDCFKEEFEE